MFEEVKGFFVYVRLKLKFSGDLRRKKKYKSERQTDIKKNRQLFDMNIQYEC
jgi:hypothetical protein